MVLLRKRYILIFGIIIIVIIVIAIFFISRKEKTPVIKNVTSVYLEFVEADRLWDGGGSAEYTRKEITDPTDKEYLIDLFDNEYELDELTCGCPCDNIKIVFDTVDAVHTFGVGVVGDGNFIYYNSGKYLGIPHESYMELMRFFSKFDETADYEESWINGFR